MKQHIVLFVALAALFAACTKTDITTPSKSLSNKTQEDSYYHPSYDSVTFFAGKLTPTGNAIDSSVQLLMGDQFYLPKDCYIKTINFSVVRVGGICRNVWILLDGTYLQEIEHPVGYLYDSAFKFAPNFPLKRGYHTVQFVGQTISTDKQNMYFDILQGDATFIDMTATVLPVSGLPISKERIYHSKGN